MAIVRRRYYFWLFRAYIKRWSKTILSSLILGVIFFFIVLFVFNFYILPVFEKKVQKIGYFGTYTAANIPDEVLRDVSYGLTKVNNNGSISPAAAYRWSVRDNGKSYIFYIKKGQYFDNNRELTAETFSLNFKDVKKEVIDKYTVKLSLREVYSPFLAVVAKPILSKDFEGLGAYQISKVELNGGFIKFITLQNKKNGQYKKIITFYPTQEALKTAYALGDVDTASGLSDVDLKNSNLKNWENTIVTKQTDFSELLTLFYNNADSMLSDKKLREALSYALPPEFSKGQRAYSPIPPQSIYFSKDPNYGISDVRIASSLIADNNDAKKIVFEISTPEEYESVAKEISNAWSRIGIRSKIKITTGLPKNFQIALHPMRLPEDPDQYTLWHSTGINNIINYKKNQRIDKLLEDGRSTLDQETRVSIYADFQKYLADDAPASFVYFPYEYTVSRK